MCQIGLTGLVVKMCVKKRTNYNDTKIHIMFSALDIKIVQFRLDPPPLSQVAVTV